MGELVRRYRVVIWFVLGLVALDRLVAARARLWEAYDVHPYRELVRRCHQGRWDLLVVGGSPAMCGLDPVVLAGTPWAGRPLATAYNIGLPLGTADDVALAVEHGPKAPPRLIVYGATATDFNDHRVERHAAQHLMTLSDLARTAAGRPASAGDYARFYVSERAARAWPLYYHRRGIRLWLADVAEAHWPGTCPDEAAEARRGLFVATTLRNGVGYCIHPPVSPATRLDCLKAEGKVSDVFPFMDGYRVGDRYLASLDRMLARSAKEGVPVVIVDLPVPADLDTRLFAEQFAAYRAALAKAAAAHNVPVLWATRDAVGLTDADFADLVHVNGNGAAKLSRWVRGAIAAGPTGGPISVAERADR
jgi:hypothetical protein